MSPAPKIASPCIDVCVIDPATRLCSGCLRSIDEITAWSSMSETARGAVMADLPSRSVSADAPRRKARAAPNISRG